MRLQGNLALVTTDAILVAWHMLFGDPFFFQEFNQLSLASNFLLI